MMAQHNIDLGNFLESYPGMRIRPSPLAALHLEGHLEFKAVYNDVEISDVYSLRINIPYAYPREIPMVIELDERIPRHIDNHISEEGILCLGSTFRLYIISHEPGTFADFTEKAIIPYLYSFSYKEKYGAYPYDELAHGQSGLLEDYADILGLDTNKQAEKAISLLAMKPRIANKKSCPCGCGSRLGVCPYNQTVHILRKKYGRKIFKKLELQIQRCN